ncbi:MAG: hypothetical protein A2046_00740 [Bacteroidetes bacterium GWA2_30_7]|nr:MAG: hypothetical protein A2046_00740 [Bacteroidetes bacterium GWA2_30_7]
MKKKLAYLILKLLLILIIAFPQSRLDFGLNVIPALSTINTEGHDIGFEFLKPINYGISVAYKKKKMLISTGILKITQGSKFQVEITTNELPEGGIGTYDNFIRIKSLIIPLNISYVLTSKNTGFTGSIGIYSGYVYKQQLENTSISKDNQPPSNIIYLNGPPKRFNDIDMFEKLYFGANIGIGLQQFISKKMSYIIRPNFLFQLRKELPREQYPWTYRLMSLSIDIGFYYSIGKETKKD